MHDVVVVGGGPAGAVTALLLARSGAAVCVIERAHFPRTKVCGEYLSAGAVRLLAELGLASRLAPHARPVTGVRLHGHGLHTTIDFPATGWSLPRATLDGVLLDAARSAGAQVLQAHVEDCVQRADRVGVAVRCAEGAVTSVEGRWVVGADGAHSLVARACGVSARQRGPARFALGGHYTGVRSLDGYIDMFVEGRSYLAINPLDGESANVMLIVGGRDLRRARADIEAFVRDRIVRLGGDRLSQAQRSSKRMAIGPLAYRARRLRAGRVLLVGDAAAFVDPFTGQGVYLALRGARIAAEAIATDSVRDYEKRLRREIASRERLARRVSWLIASPLAAIVAARILARKHSPLRTLVDRVVGAA